MAVTGSMSVGLVGLHIYGEPARSVSDSRRLLAAETVTKPVAVQGLAARQAIGENMG